MKILIAGAPDKYFHLKEFGEELKKQKIEYVLVNDSDYATGISKKNIRDFLNPKKKFNELIKKEKPDVIFADRRTNFGIYARRRMPNTDKHFGNKTTIPYTVNTMR